MENTYYRDVDSDTYGNAFAITQACSQPLGYVSNSMDCDDNNVSINPGAAETCNGVDDNCNTQADEGYNQDGDGYTTCAGDCNDNNASINPAATEVCNGIDDNCNGQTDESVLNKYYQDADGDGYGNLNQTAQACTQLSGYVSDSTDCNDNVAGVNPAASDVICDGVDNNCNGTSDDGYVPSSTTCGTGVCGATGQLVCLSGQTQDTCTAGQPTGADDNCNGIDENCSGVADDGYVPTATSCGAGVCGATGQLVCVNGQTQDTCTAGQPTGIDDNCNGFDEDCNGVADDGYVTSTTSCGIGVCASIGQLICAGGSIQDTCVAGPPQTEVCNGIDDNCDGLTDEDYSDLGSACSAGIGACSASGTMVCNVAGSGTICDAQPGQPSAEVCDGVDNDCDGTTDEGCLTVTAVSPWVLPQGATSQTLTLTGSNFARGATVGFSGSGITVNSITFVNNTQMTMNVTVAATAPTGVRDVTVTNPGGVSGTGVGLLTIATRKGSIGIMREQISGFLSSGQIANNGIANSLLASLDNAEKALDKNNPNSAKGILNALLNKLDAFTKGGQITTAVRDKFVAEINALISSL